MSFRLHRAEVREAWDRLSFHRHGFEEHRQRALTILNDPNQIATPDEVMGDLVANHWVDANHKRGLWRVSPLADYLAGKPVWRTLIDVDALGKAEDKSWVWHGANCLPPEYQRCLVSLSPGGSDADVIREFDLQAGKFVEGGFVVPESKNSAEWADRDTLDRWTTSKGPEGVRAYQREKNKTSIDGLPALQVG